MDIIDLFTEMEQIDLLRSQKITGSMRKLVQALCELYETLSSLSRGSPASSEQLHGTIPFALACRYELLMAITMAFRGHLSNSNHFTRRAIELCAFAARISRHPHLMLEWRQSWNDLSRYDKLREKFSKEVVSRRPARTKAIVWSLRIFVRNSCTRPSSHCPDI